jgi:monothiol glutaredoxin
MQSGSLSPAAFAFSGKPLLIVQVTNGLTQGRSCQTPADLNIMEKPTITAWLKTYCGWSNGVRAVLKKYDLEYTDKDIIQNPAFRWEMEQKSGQPLSPCVEVNGTILADISGEELEQWMLQQGLVGQTERTTNVPLNAACSDAEHAAMAQGIPLKMHGDKVQP